MNGFMIVGAVFTGIVAALSIACFLVGDATFGIYGALAVGIVANAVQREIAAVESEEIR